MTGGERATSASATPTFGFVLGTGRCGSTLLHELVARHHDVGFVSNLDDRLRSTRLSRWNNPVFRRVPALATTKGRPRFAPSEGYRILARAVSPALRDVCRDLAASDATPWLRDRTRRFFLDAAAHQAKPVFLHKFTGWPRVGFTSAALPEARFVHVVRDGRAVANSFLQMPWWRGYAGPDAWGLGPLPDGMRSRWEESGRSFVLLAGLAWTILVDAFALARAGVDAGRWLDVRYEDLVSQPVVTLARVERFLGLEPTNDLEARTAAYRIRPGRCDAYLHELDAEDVTLLDRTLGERLATLGYPPVATSG